MSSLKVLEPMHADSRLATAQRRDASSLYHALMHQPTPFAIEAAAEFLQDQLQRAATQPCDLPEDPQQLCAWIAQGAARVAEEYGHYLEQRRAGGGRRFFTNKAHALYFLQHVAPTKLVDGAWLYGLLPHWADYRFHGLIRTYLEELGDGDPSQNHVVLYRKLLADQGCDLDTELTDEHYLQGALQLALGYQADRFLPEVIGYNLGYEQLPLHLLISSFELNELGIDPYYFTLHVTVDNASTGHARKAAQSVLELMPVDADPKAFYRRVAAGYRLNELGIGSRAVIESFDLEQEVVDMLERKRTFGQHMHSDYCRFEGKTVNQWLAEPGQIKAFLTVMQTKGWIKRHENPQHSRFWQLLEGPGAAMFGVFSPYEKQLLHDWIAGDWCCEDSSQADTGKRALRPNAFRPRFRQPARQGFAVAASEASTDPDSQCLQADLRQASPAERMRHLIERMSAGRHCTPAGLLATRMFTEAMGQGAAAQ